MTNLSDFLSASSTDNFLRITIAVGNVYKINFTLSDGITPKNNEASRNKYFIVLGVDDTYVYGGVVINSHINMNVPTSIKDLHMPIKKSNYPFLHHDSFVNCSRIFKASLTKFNNQMFVGCITEEDTNIIIDTIKCSPLVSKAELKRFSL